jgi:hypothetical protein
MLGDQRADRRPVCSSCRGDAFDLQKRSRGRNVRVEPAAGCSDEVMGTDAPPFAELIRCASAVTRSTSVFEVGPRLLPPVEAAS